MGRLRPSDLLLATLCLAATLTPGETTLCSADKQPKQCVQEVLDQNMANVKKWLGWTTAIFSIPDQEEEVDTRSTDTDNPMTAHYRLTNIIADGFGKVIEDMKVQEVNNKSVSILLSGYWLNLEIEMKASATYGGWAGDVGLFVGLFGIAKIKFVNITTSVTATWNITDNGTGRIFAPSDTVVTVRMRGVTTRLILDDQATLYQFDNESQRGAIAARDEIYRRGEAYLLRNIQRTWNESRVTIETNLKSIIRKAFDEKVRSNLFMTFENILHRLT